MPFAVCIRNWPHCLAVILSISFNRTIVADSWIFRAFEAVISDFRPASQRMGQWVVDK